MTIQDRDSIKKAIKAMFEGGVVSDEEAKLVAEFIRRHGIFSQPDAEQTALLMGIEKAEDLRSFVTGQGLTEWVNRTFKIFYGI